MLSSVLIGLITGIISGLITGLYTGCVMNEASRFDDIKQRAIIMIREWTQEKTFDLVYKESLTKERLKPKRIAPEEFNFDFSPIKHYDCVYALDINCLLQEFLKLGHDDASKRTHALHEKYREIYNAAKRNERDKTDELFNACYQEYLSI